MKKLSTYIILALATLLAAGPTATAQSPGPFYRQFFFNPYLFNPGFVGINNELEANLLYRQQWVNFNDAPVTAGVNLQFPTSDRVALGFNLYSDRQVILTNTNFMATFGYIVPFSANQSLRFGLSGGVGLNKLDLTAEELNTNDPAILNASGNNWYVDGNFGAVYTLAGLRIGFALTDIFKSNTFNTENFNEFELSNLRNRLYSISYRFSLGPTQNFSLEPYFLYRQTEDGLQDSWEGAAIAYFKDKVWTGGSYNQNNGLALFFGVSLKQKFVFSYSYEFPPMNSGFTTTSSHELHIGVKLSRKTRKPAPAITTTMPDLSVIEQDSLTNLAGNKNPGRVVVGEPEQTQNLETPIIIDDKELQRQDVVQQPTEVQVIIPEPTPEEAPKTPPVRPKESFTLTPGHHYVVVGVFSVMSHSMKFTKDMLNRGYTVNVALNPKNNLYYVYIFSALDVEEARKVRNEFRWKNLFKEAWVFSME
jgi:type IX secretion system PorP/SprF family membrane protein